MRQDGQDLFTGSTFWIYVSPLRAFIRRLGRKVQDYTGRGNDVYQTLRFESTQATITAMHACVLEGIKFAVTGSDRASAGDTPLSVAAAGSPPAEARPTVTIPPGPQQATAWVPR